MRAWQALVAIAGLFGPSSGQQYRCYTIENKCTTDVYVAFGYARSKNKWQTEAWWKVAGGLSKKYCFIRSSYLYAYFDWAGGRIGQALSDVNFWIRLPSPFCVGQKKASITEFNSDNVTKFTNDLTGDSATTCEGLGIGATMRFFTVIDDGHYDSTSISKSQCPSSTRRDSNASAIVLEKSYEANPNSTHLERFINATHPLAVFGYHPEEGWSLEEAQEGRESSEEPLLP
eukprot:Skav208884  [mRNA]  locus=scaffold270:313034:313723:- [translate_table: standard]